jgi:hypothetical protein
MSQRVDVGRREQERNGIDKLANQERNIQSESTAKADRNLALKTDAGVVRYVIRDPDFWED